MNAEALTKERILDAAEEVLRRFGPRKTTVVDVARALDVSHGTVYRHFPTKAALRDAVAARWLHRVSQPLQEIAYKKGPAEARLNRWLDKLVAVKRSKVRDDPEMFAAYSALAEDSREVVAAHVAELIAQLERIIVDGMQEGAFTAGDPLTTARAVLDTTARFHHPAHSQEWGDPKIDAQFQAARQLVLDGLRCPSRC